MCAGVIRKYHQICPDSDATAYKIGISVKNWARRCLFSVDMWRMGPIMSWFALGFVMSDATFLMIFLVFVLDYCEYRGNWLEQHDGTLHIHSKLSKRKSYWSLNLKIGIVLASYEVFRCYTHMIVWILVWKIPKCCRFCAPKCPFCAPECPFLCAPKCPFAPECPFSLHSISRKFIREVRTPTHFPFFS